MEYDFNQLDPIKFQRLVNTILVTRFGEYTRLTPLRGPDGGRDAETAPENPYLEFQIGDLSVPVGGIVEPPKKGRYLFQVKHHRTTDLRLTEARQAVLSDFGDELRSNVLTREGKERVNYFFLITNVPSSKEAILGVDRVRKELLKGETLGYTLHADIWWQERLVAFLDQMPLIWNTFPEIFPGGRVPVLAEIVGQSSAVLPRAIRLAVTKHYELDKHVKFRQIELEQDLAKLYVDLDVDISEIVPDALKEILLDAEIPTAYSSLQESLLSFLESDRFPDSIAQSEAMTMVSRFYASETSWELQNITSALREELTRKQTEVQSSLFGYIRHRSFGALNFLMRLSEGPRLRKIILEGGPGQGKSTITQMMSQIYRQQVLTLDEIEPKGRWMLPSKTRLVFRLEVRKLAEWLTKNEDGSIEQYLAATIKQDSGGSEISVDQIHSIAEASPMLITFDGLDEVGSDQLRDRVLSAILDFVHRFEHHLRADLRVIVTTRPPAIAGRRERISDFARLSLAPMDNERVTEYCTRWLSVQVKEQDEKERIREAFERRQREPHVRALAKNPMQLSVLLQFIRLKGDAFPARRAELYRDYFQIVIDRDVEKSAELRENRQVVEALHEFLGYKLHALTEVNQADRTLERGQLLHLVESWLRSRGGNPQMARQFFRIGEERFGLIVAPKGEGEETRYGYEVQPVQEYFAAAFISNQIPPSNAHEVFEAMIRRPYWKEVALFLAGLRRPNEKADLVARARQLDQQDELGWRQDGRAIILQLLKEGVFTEPPYVYSQALDLVLDLLDIKQVKAQHQPPDLLGDLAELLREGGSNRHKGRLSKLLYDQRTSADTLVVERLYRVARQILEPNELHRRMLSYEGANQALTARLRLQWPYVWGIDMSEAMSSPSFWAGVPDSLWAEAWWNAALTSGEARSLAAPGRLHQRLIEQFAFNPTAICPPQHHNGRVIALESNWAVWVLVGYHQLIYETLTCEDGRNKSLSGLVTASSVEYGGLDASVHETVKVLVESSELFLLSVCTDEANQETALRDYANTIVNLVQMPGLGGWLACRSALDLLLAITASARFSHSATISQTGTRLAGSEQAVQLMLSSLQPMYGGLEKSDVYSEGQQAFQLLLAGDYPATLRYLGRQVGTSLVASILASEGRQVASPIPTHVRLEAGREPVSIIELLSASIAEEQEPSLNWIKDVSYSAEIIFPLLREFSRSLVKLLPALTTLRYSSFRARTPVKDKDARRILAIASKADDRVIQAGALIALSNSKFLEFAPIDLALELIGASYARPEFAARLFRSRRKARTGGSQGADSASQETEALRNIAKRIVNAAESYAFEIVCAAADFLVEYDQVTFPPLLLVESDLGIQISDT